MDTSPIILQVTSIGSRYPPRLHTIWTSGMILEIVASHMANVACGMSTRNMPEHPGPQVRVTPSHKWTGHMAGLTGMVNNGILRCVHHMGISVVLIILRVQAKAKVRMARIHTKQEREKAGRTPKAKVKARAKEKAKAREKAKVMERRRERIWRCQGQHKRKGQRYISFSPRSRACGQGAHPYRGRIPLGRPMG